MRIHGHGMRAWMVQRLTALYMTGYLLVAGIWLLAAPPASFSEWRAWVGHPFLSLLSAVFLASVLFHSWVGIRDVIMDYIHPVGLRFMLLVVVGGFLFAMAIWALRVILISSIG